ncbi:MAG: outer rane assembly lipoYfiO family protein [Pseudomonadota bacterium]
MRLFRLSMLHGSLMGVSLFLIACSSTPKDPTIAWSPEEIYAEALDERAAGNTERAIAYFDKLEGRAAGTPLAQQAQLEKAFTHYKVNELPLAEVTLDRFMRLHPASPAMDYALYLKGLVSFNDNLGFLGRFSQQDLSERDQKAAKESFESFRQLIVRFPNSRYALDARARLTHVVNSLAQYEVHVARYYHSRGAHIAAINRAQSAITDFPGTPALEEALYLLVRSYDALALTDLRDDARRVLAASYPDSRFLR